MRKDRKTCFIYPALILGVALLCCGVSRAQRMGPFCSFSVNQEPDGNVSIGPYIGTVSYFGYFEDGNLADDTSANQNKYYFYFSLPQSTNEIGARALSPIPTTIMPSRGDQVAMNYFENETNKSDFFDPVIMLEKCVNDESGKGVWVQLGINDNSEELPAQPTGERNNALIRVSSDSVDVSKMLVPGVYRIVVKDKFDRPAVGGCFLQVGTTCRVSGLWLYKSPAEMAVKNFSCRY